MISDASFCPNTNAAGWAVWITATLEYGAEPTRERHSGNFRDEVTKPSDAERLACFIGLWYAYRLGARDILVQTDCLDVVTKADGNAGFRRAMEEHWPDASINWRHVKGHTNLDSPRFYVNRWCDSKAKAAMRRQRRERQHDAR